MTLALVAVCLLVVAAAALIALRMRQRHELALLAAQPKAEAPSGPDPKLEALEKRVTVLEQGAILSRGPKRRA